MSRISLVVILFLGFATLLGAAHGVTNEAQSATPSADCPTDDRRRKRGHRPAVARRGSERRQPRRSRRNRRARHHPSCWNVPGSVVGRYHQVVLEMLITGFPDVKHTIDDVITEDDLVVILWTATGTQTGEFQGIAPTGQQGDLDWSQYLSLRVREDRRGLVRTGWPRPAEAAWCHGDAGSVAGQRKRDRTRYRSVLGESQGDSAVPGRNWMLRVASSRRCSPSSWPLARRRPMGTGTAQEATPAAECPAMSEEQNVAVARRFLEDAIGGHDANVLTRSWRPRWCITRQQARTSTRSRRSFR